MLTVLGSNLGEQSNDSSVWVGTKECVIARWTPSNVTCRLPVLPPGFYRVDVQVGNNGFPQSRCRNFKGRSCEKTLVSQHAASKKRPMFITGLLWNV